MSCGLNDVTYLERQSIFVVKGATVTHSYYGQGIETKKPKLVPNI